MSKTINESVVASRVEYFSGHAIRIVELRYGINIYVVLQDFFNALGRLDSTGKVTSRDRKKLEKIIRGENIVKIKVECKSKNKYSRKSQTMLCSPLQVLEKNKDKILISFGKGINPTNIREEYNFTNKVLDFFKYDKNTFVATQFPMMEFRVDLVIGEWVFVEYDETGHNSPTNKQKDYERMQKIALSNAVSYYEDELYLSACGTNNWREYHAEEKDYGDFSIYDFGSGLFIRVRDKNCLSWIPLVYEHYHEYMDFRFDKPKQLVKHSDELDSLPFTE